MTENSNSNDDNGAGQIAMTDDLFGWPGDGVHWTWQRCGRYEYRKVLMHSTNPDHLVPSRPSLTDASTNNIVKLIGEERIQLAVEKPNALLRRSTWPPTRRTRNKSSGKQTGNRAA